MNPLQMSNENSSVKKPATAFPSLDDSPLWADDFVVPRQPETAATPPLMVIRTHYPRIAKAIELMWGAPELNDYFSRLVIDDRRDRAGFSPEVMAALLKLSAEHLKRFRFIQPESSSDAWGIDRYQKSTRK